MKVVECPDCGGYVPVEYEQCQNCGHRMKASAPRAPIRSISAARRKNPHILRAVIVGGLVLVLAIVISWMLFTQPFSPTQVKVVVEYAHPWSGAIGDLYGINTWGSTGSYTQVLHKTHSGSWIVSANAQKEDGSTATLRISIITMDGKVLRSATTSEPYGVAQVAVMI
jgi:hypothetical protein